MTELKGKNILVTGGAGFIGSHLVDRIIKAKPGGLIVVDNLFLGKEKNLSEARSAYPALKFFKEDAADYETMKAILKQGNVDVVFDLAVIPLPTSLERPRWAVDINVGITTTLCELQREGNYQTLIHFSSSEAYGTAQCVPMDEDHPLNPETPYAASKLAGDHIILSYRHTFGTDAAIVRPFNNYGPRQNDGTYAGIIPIVINKALRREPMIIFGDGNQTRDYVFARDTADAAVRIYENPATRGKIINIASGHEISVNQLVRKLLSVMGKDLPIIYDQPRPGDVRRHCGGVKCAASLIGFEPAVLSDENLKETIDWYLGERSCA